MARNEFLQIEVKGIDGVSNWLLMTDKSLYKATKHGIWKASKAIEQQTLSNIAASPFKSDLLRYGVKHYFDSATLSGSVDILGSDKYYNSFRLRFFEGGTKLRKSKHGKNYGRIKAYNFFKNAIISTQGRVYQIVRDTIYEKISFLNNE